MIRPPPRSPLFPYTRSPDLFELARYAEVEPLLRRVLAIDEQRNGPDHPDVANRKSTRLNSSHLVISYAVFCLKKKKRTNACRTSQQKNLRILVHRTNQHERR